MVEIELNDCSRAARMSASGRIESDELGNLLLHTVLKRGQDHCSRIYLEWQSRFEAGLFGDLSKIVESVVW